MKRLSPAINSWLTTVLLSSLVIGSGVIVARQLGWLERSELQTYDDFIMRRGSEGADKRLLVVGFTEDDIQSLKEFPLHDGTLAQVIEKLDRYDPALIGLDIGRDIPQGPPAGRERLRKTIEKNDRVISACFMSSMDDPGVPAAPGTPDDRIAFASDFPQDKDKVIRRTVLISTPIQPQRAVVNHHLCNDANPENEIQSLSFTLASLYLADKGIEPKAADSGEIKLGNVILPRLPVSAAAYSEPVATDYQLMLNYRSPNNSVQQVSFSDVLSDKVDPDLVKNRIVLLGYLSPIAKDFLATPYIQVTTNQREMYGVVVHAQATSQLLSAVLDKRPLIRTSSRLFENIWILFWAISSAILAYHCNRFWLFLLAETILLTICWGACYVLFVSQGLWLTIVPTMLSILLTAITVRLINGANKGGYTQAFFEDFLSQIRQTNQVSDEEQLEKDYFQRLVRKASAIRNGESEGDLDRQKRDRLANEIRPQLYGEIEAEIEKKVRLKLSQESQSHEFNDILKRSQTRRDNPD
jgi:adenylate cyclase